MKFDPLTYEPQMLENWESKSILAKARQKNKGNKTFTFLQGPPFTSGRIHLGHAWNHSLKDMVLRYKRMKGFDVWDRGGYDMHGLPTEQKVMAKHGLKLNPEIIEFGEENFVKECQSFSTEMMEYMNTDFKKLGFSLDFENSYQPIKPTYIEGVWALIKKAHESNRLYLGKRTMGWSAAFETALAKHEMEYKTITDTSVYVKFKLVDEENTYAVIWTTTPWTLPFNLAIMVNPSALYVKVKAGDETYIVAKDLVETVMKKGLIEEFEIIEEFEGKTLEGINYSHPWADKIPALASVDAKNKHTIVVSAKYVETSGGTGLVHCAPGCGPEDYEVGYEYGLPAFNEVLEDGTFPSSMGFAQGKIAKTDDLFFVQTLKEDGMLFAKQKITHEYPHCERSKTPVIFRTTEQWFFKTEDLKERMLELNKDVNWIPESAKNAFNSWLDNLRDNSITKQRFWGTPAPIWVNTKDKHDIIVIGSMKELASYGVDVPSDLHKPYIDEVVIQKDGKTYKRIPDVLDVWIDSGSASWNCFDMLQNPEQFEKWFPADFIVEGKDQIRGWFNLLMVTSAVMFDKVPFKNVFLHGFLAGIDGEKMSKSLGNVISPFEIVDKYGADTLRYYTSKIRPGEDISFSWEEITLHYRNISMLYNVVGYLKDLVSQSTESVEELMNKPVTFNHEEKYIYSRLHSTIKQTDERYDTYQLNQVSPLFESLLLDISREYIQAVRDKSQGEQKAVVVQTLVTVIDSFLKLAHPVIPFVTDYLYGELSKIVPSVFTEESCLLTDWPTVDESLIDTDLEEKVSIAEQVTQSILAAREKAKRGVRWPIAKVSVASTDSIVSDMLSLLGEQIKTKTNVKEIEVVRTFTDVTYSVKPNFRSIGKVHGDLTKQIVAYISSISDASSVVSSLQKDNEVIVNIDGHDITLSKDMFVLEQQVPDEYVQNDFTQGDVYLYLPLTDELESEGYVREFMRRIQSQRKDMGLTKEQLVSATFMVDERLKLAIDAHEKMIKQKCGIVNFFYVTELEGQVVGKIKEENFSFILSKNECC